MVEADPRDGDSGDAMVAAPCSACPVRENLDRLLRLSSLGLRATMALVLRDACGAIRVIRKGGAPCWKPALPDDPFLPWLETLPDAGMATSDTLPFPSLSTGEGPVNGSFLTISLFSSTGERIGSLVAGDSQNRVWTEEDRAFLQQAATLLTDVGLRIGSESTNVASMPRNASGLQAGDSCLLRRRLETQAIEVCQRDAHRHLDELLANLPVVAWETQGTATLASHRMTFISSSCQQVFGFQLDVQHQDPDVLWRLVHPEEIERLSQDIETMLARRSGSRSAYRLIRPDGRVVWVESNIEVVLDEEGEPVGLRGVSIDISEQKRAEAALRESEARYRRLLDTAQEGIWILDASARTEYINQRMAEMLGFGPEEMAGRLLFDFLDDEGLALARRNLERRRNGVREALDFHFHRRDGADLWAIISTTPIWNEAGEYAGALGMFTDITQRKRVEARQDILARAGEILSASLDYEVTLQSVTRLLIPLIADYCIVDILTDSGDLRHVAVAHRDPEKETILHEIRRRYPFDPNAHSGVPLVVRTGRSELNAESQDEWLEIGARDPEHLCLLRALGMTSALAVPLKARGRTLGAISLFTSESRRHYNEDDVALAEELAIRCALAIDNARLYDELQQLSRAKDEFLATLGHELRNPLGALANALRAVRLGGVASSEKDQVNAQMEQQVHQMTRLVDDLLDVARITNGQFSLRRENVNLRAAVQTAVQGLRPVMKRRRQRLEVHGLDRGIFLNADPLRLNQVFFNLLQNASKYTPDGGWISLTADRDGPSVILTIRDNGIGISPEMLPRVFQLFRQGERTLDRPGAGLGIGLTLVKRLVEMHGGTVQAESAGINQGCTFTVRLPALPAAPEMAHAPQGTVPAPPPLEAAPCRRVLLVDDNTFGAGMLARVLEASGHSVRVLGDGSAALDAVEVERPDIVILDIGLPGMDGYEVARRLRADARFHGLYLVALTGYGRAEDRERALAVGFNEHLVKPVNLEALLRLLEELPASTVPDHA